MSCKKPEPLPFAHLPESVLEKNYFPPGSIVTYICNYGYVNTTSTTVICGMGGNWSKVPGFCKGNGTGPVALLVGVGVRTELGDGQQG